MIVEDTQEHLLEPEESNKSFLKWISGRPEMFLLLILSGLLNFWNLSQNGFANSFYTAAVKSMSGSWHNFFYASFDPKGVMTIDKPPLAFWVESLSVRVFGNHSISYLAPQAVIGMITVALVYDLTRRYFGRVAGFSAGLILALTPIAVAMSRHNNPDALLILCAVAALWCAVRGLEKQQTIWILLAGVFVGLGFETKFSVILLVVPGISLAWFYVANHGRIKAALQLLASGFIAALVGLAWPIFFALTPASQRPWISGTSNNNIWSLIMGYNGLGRITGQAGEPVAASAPPVLQPTAGQPIVTHLTSANTAGETIFGGYPSPLRLLDAGLGGQAGWFIGLAIAGLITLLLVNRFKREAFGWLLIVGSGFILAALTFSVAHGIMHPYYVSFLAPFVAILAGGFIGIAFQLEKEPLMRYLLPLGIAGGFIVELAVRHNVSSYHWLRVPLIWAGCLALLLIISNFRRLPYIGVTLAVLSLMVLPGIWAIDTLSYPASSTFPAGGPKGQGYASAPNITSPKSAASLNNLSYYTTGEFSYISSHGGGELAVYSQSAAAIGVIYGYPVLGLGGFSGEDTELTPSWLAHLVTTRKVRWVDVWGSRGPFAPGLIGAKIVMTAVEKTCSLSSYAPASRVYDKTLYDCQGHAAQLQSVSVNYQNNTISLPAK